jgi:hypothetical protein
MRAGHRTCQIGRVNGFPQQCPGNRFEWRKFTIGVAEAARDRVAREAATGCQAVSRLPELSASIVRKPISPMRDRSTGRFDFETVDLSFSIRFPSAHRCPLELNGW